MLSLHAFVPQKTMFGFADQSEDFFSVFHGAFLCNNAWHEFMYISLCYLGRPWCVQQSDTWVRSCRIASSAVSHCEQLPCSCPPSYWCSSWAQSAHTLWETHLKDRGRGNSFRPGYVHQRASEVLTHTQVKSHPTEQREEGITLWSIHSFVIWRWIKVLGGLSMFPTIYWSMEMFNIFLE